MRNTSKSRVNSQRKVASVLGTQQLFDSSVEYTNRGTSSRGRGASRRSKGGSGYSYSLRDITNESIGEISCVMDQTRYGIEWPPLAPKHGMVNQKCVGSNIKQHPPDLQVGDGRVKDVAIGPGEINVESAPMEDIQDAVIEDNSRVGEDTTLPTCT